jgi:asparagine synthetase B (glutamine-hydrolysing)
MQYVFPDTLLQRYDRVFARSCIEGRVPFLDQEFVWMVSQLAFIDKI